MRAPHQLGDFPGPVKYGYINVGEVEAGPADWIGRRVFCLYPHQTRYCVALADVHPLPASLPPGRAVLAANMETAINGLWDLQPLVGDRIAVVGGGVVGLLVGWLAARTAARVELVDVDPSRAAIAEGLGLHFAAPEAATGDCDRVVHASGHPEGLVTALGLAGQEATVLELSWYGDRRVSLPLGEAFHARRLTIRSSQVGTIAPAQRPRWTYGRRMTLALDLLGDARLDALITGESPFDELPAVLARLSASPPPAATLCHRIRYDPEIDRCTPSAFATT
jgi:threonine dehydrogenase-like Zn-dependent dehydrogenase